MFAKVRSWLSQVFSRRQPSADFSFDGCVIHLDLPDETRISLALDEIEEFGVETTAAGPFLEDVFWLIHGGELQFRIPQNSPVFDELMDYFHSLEGFDWKSFSLAMCSTDCN